MRLCLEQIAEKAAEIKCGEFSEVEPEKWDDQRTHGRINMPLGELKSPVPLKDPQPVERS